MAVAEIVLAQLWYELEEHGLPSPGVVADFDTEGSVAVSLTFSSGVDLRPLEQVIEHLTRLARAESEQRRPSVQRWPAASSGLPRA